jgi:excisionase family DNA binding protein
MATTESASAEKAAPQRRGTSPEALAKQLGVSPASVLRGVHRGEVRAVRFGKRLIIPADEGDRILALAILKDPPAEA